MLLLQSKKELVTDKYSIIIYPIEDYYFAYHPEFGWSACSATGDTPEEAAETLPQVREAVIAHYILRGKEIPKPNPVPKELLD